MTASIALGEAFRLNSGALPAGDERHLMIVATDPTHPGGRVVVVRVTTFSQYKDGECVLEPGDHPFIKHKSLVCYRDAILCKVGKVLEQLERGLMLREGAVSPEVVDRIQEGARRSSSFPKECAAFLPDRRR